MLGCVNPERMEFYLRNNISTDSSYKLALFKTSPDNNPQAAFLVYFHQVKISFLRIIIHYTSLILYGVKTL